MISCRRLTAARSTAGRKQAEDKAKEMLWSCWANKHLTHTMHCRPHTATAQPQKHLEDLRNTSSGAAAHATAGIQWVSRASHEQNVQWPGTRTSEHQQTWCQYVRGLKEVWNDYTSTSRNWTKMEVILTPTVWQCQEGWVEYSCFISCLSQFPGVGARPMGVRAISLVYCCCNLEEMGSAAPQLSSK